MILELFSFAFLTPFLEIWHAVSKPLLCLIVFFPSKYS